MFSQNFFTIDDLNARIETYDFGANKLVLIDRKLASLPTAKIRQSASQMMTLITELPLLIGDRIPNDDIHWYSFLVLIKICSIAVSPVCTHDTIAYLRVLIEEKLALFLQLYPDKHLIPKHHIKIYSIAVSPVCTHDTIAYLRVLIEEKLALFLQLYPDKHLIPKHHYMVHYPSLIERLGPLIHSWNMRQESKLSFIKRVSRRSNYENVSKTVAKKHQF